jgi:hypothetical protein
LDGVKNSELDSYQEKTYIIVLAAQSTTGIMGTILSRVKNPPTGLVKNPPVPAHQEIRENFIV